MITNWDDLEVGKSYLIVERGWFLYCRLSSKRAPHSYKVDLCLAVCHGREDLDTSPEELLEGETRWDNLCLWNTYTYSEGTIGQWNTLKDTFLGAIPLRGPKTVYHKELIPRLRRMGLLRKGIPNVNDIFAGEER